MKIAALPFGDLNGILLESPVAMPDGGFLVVDIDGRKIFRLAENGRCISQFESEDKIGGVVQTSDPDVLLYASGRHLKKLISFQHSKSFVDNVEPTTGARLNDIRALADGLLYGGSCFGSAGFVRVSAAGRVEQLFTDIQISNGFGVIDDKLIYIDSLDLASAPGPCLQIRNYNLHGQPGEVSRVKVNLPLPLNEKVAPVVLDGLAIDCENMLWVAVNGAGVVLRVEPFTGEVMAVIDLPTAEVTSCCFSGRRLLITTAKERYLQASQLPHENAGKLFIVEQMPVAGAEVSVFRLD